MADDRLGEWLPDVAALAVLSVAVHYLLGLYGLLGALLLIVLLDHGAQLRGKPRLGLADGRTPSTRGGADASTTPADDPHELRPRELQDATADPQVQLREDEDNDNDSEPNGRTSALVVRDVGSVRRTSTARRHRVPLNARTPVSIETELFVGHALLLVRTEPEDPQHAALFAGKRRLFWIQVQGQFKQPPPGPVYLGGELPAQIALGVFTRSIALVIMRLIRRLVGRVSFSFGSAVDSERDGSGGAVDELPAVAFPLFQSVDQLVETPEGETPPVLGTSDFGEGDDAREKRRQTAVGAETLRVGPTYTFDFHTMYVDLVKWETANLPSGLNAINLASFFDSLPLRLVAYAVRPTAAGVVMDRHRQQDKEYLFSFEVEFDKRRQELSGRRGGTATTAQEARQGRPRPDDGRAPMLAGLGLSGMMGSEMSTMSTTLSDASSMTEEDPVLAQDHADFMRLEHARRLGQLSFSYLCWMEEVNVASDVRRVHYVFAVKDKVGEYDEEALEEDDEVTKLQSRYRLAIVSSYELRHLLMGRHALRYGKVAEELAKLRFHSRSRIGSYSTISTEVQQVVLHLQRLASEPLRPSAPPSYASSCMSDTDSFSEGKSGDEQKCLEEVRLVAAQAALYRCLTKRQRLQELCASSTRLSPSRIGVNLSRHDREDMGVIFEGVVYRYYSAELLRQEVLLLTNDALLFYRSFASSAEKQVPSAHVIGARAVEMPSFAAYRDGASGTDGAFALQVSTFAEEIVLCVGTCSARDAWVRGISQCYNPTMNFVRAREGEMCIDFATSTALRPANRVELNSRLLFPHMKCQYPQRGDASDKAGIETLFTGTISGALALVERTLTRAVHVLNNAQQLLVNDALAFLDDASALRAVDLELLHESGSHEEQVAFYLNLYHTVLAHAMIAHGFPRSKGHWSHFLTRSCYVLSRGPDREQVSLSLAEIEHVILRARMPRAELPHLAVKSVLMTVTEPGSRLQGLGVMHPDFRLSLALVVNHPGSEEVVIYDPASVHDQLNAVVRSWLRLSRAQGHLEIREDSNTIVLPRVCEWYRRDFGGADSNASAVYTRKLLGFMDNKLQLQVINAMGLDDIPLRTKFRSFTYTPKLTLALDKSRYPSVVDMKNADSTDSAAADESGGTTRL
ncbi:unnamed protein product [Hyaloperonospora brassicae]|uniref:PH domain-containing protein n=1 Tax=Hyaloperonospora brassicae TaxID=162125 RepID=A0AAV0V715_HYABA|nr:unnamed protein product [Hyaloperonospora brassicae]